MSEEKGQVQPKAEQPKEVSYTDGFDSKWQELMSIAEEPAPAAKEEAKAEVKEEVKATEPECPGCNEEQKAKAAAEKVKADNEKRTPYKVLKVQGKEHPVYTEQELIDLAQMGVDYTKKRQADSETQRDWEGKFQAKHEELETLADKFNQMFSKIGPGDAKAVSTSPEVKEPPVPTKESIYAEYGIDPEYAEPYQKKMIDDNFNLTKKLASYDAELQQIKGVTNLMILKETTMKLGEVIKDERNTHPFDEVMSEDGKDNLTQKQFMSLMMQKERDAKAQNRKVNIEELARETVRDMHTLQRTAKGNATPSVDKAMSAEDIEKNYPDLYAKILAKAKGSAVAEYEADKAKVPPSLESRKHEVDVSKVDNKKPETTDDWIDAGFKDSIVMSAFKGD